MKKIILFIVLVLVLSSLNSCKKDEDENPVKKEFRIKQIVIEDEGDLSKFIYTYENDEITLIEFYESENGSDYTLDKKIEFVYTGNNITSSFYHFIDQNTWKLYDKIEYVIDSGRMLEFFFFDNVDDQLVPSYEATYIYSGDKLITFEGFNFVHDFKTDYNYIGDKLQGTMTYKKIDNNWNELYRGDVEYEDNHIYSISNFYKYDGVWGSWYKHVYERLEEQLIKVTVYKSSGGNLWDIIDGETQITYDNEGNISEYTYNDIDNNFKVIYEYEEGIGNLNDFVSPESKIIKTDALRESYIFEFL